MILANARLILPDRICLGQVCVEGGLIADIRPSADVPSGVIDCGGDHVAPGLVELHTDNLERHMTPRPGVDWPHAAAIVAHDAELASVGITTVFDAMRVGSLSPEDRPAGADYADYAFALASELGALGRQGALRIGHFLHLRAEVCSATLIDELAAFAPDHRVGLISLMDHTPGQRQFRDMSQLIRYLRGRHGMSEAEAQAHLDQLRALRARHGAAHEAAVVAAAARLGAVLASHDDTTADQVALSARHGARLAEFPTTIEAARACRAHGIAVMMGAPNLIRGGSHSGNVAAADLARAGLLDILSSDYVPGALLCGAMRLAEMWDDLPRAIACATLTPARAAGLTDRGAIATGLRADLIRFRMVGATPTLRGVWVGGERL